MNRKNQRLIILGMSGNAGQGKLLGLLRPVLADGMKSVVWMRHKDDGEIILHTIALDNEG